MASLFEQRGGTYTAVHGILLPNLILDTPPPGSLGKFGRMRKRYLEQKHDGTFSALLLSGKLMEHLLDIDHAAREQMEALTQQMATTEGVTESLKARDPLVWVQRMNSIRHRAEEIIVNDLIYI